MNTSDTLESTLRYYPILRACEKFFLFQLTMSNS